MASKSFACPLCAAPWRAGSERCVTCGADLTDPDVRAFLGADAAPPVAEPAGTLGAGRILGVSLEGLVSGQALRQLGLVGGLLALLAFVLPALRKFHFEPPRHAGDGPRQVAEYFFSWDLWSQGNRFGLVFPLVAGVVGLVVRFAPMPTRARAGLLAATGLVGVLFGLGRLGSYALAPTQTATLLVAGVLVAGAAMAARVLLPTSMNARHALALGGVLFLAGLLVPSASLAKQLPGDYVLAADYLDLDLDGVPLVAIAGGLDRRVSELFFVALWLLAPLVLVPLSAALAWKQPSGIWDKGGLALRPLAWMLVLYLPILHATLAFSAFGWDNPLAESAVVGRLRLFVLALPAAVWAQLGLLALVVARGRTSTGAAPTAG